MRQEQEEQKTETLDTCAFDTSAPDTGASDNRAQEVHVVQEQYETSNLQDVQTIQAIRFLKETEQFVGPELEIYGPFSVGATASVPLPIAEILIECGQAELLKELFKS